MIKKKLGVVDSKKKLFARDYSTREELQIAVGKLVSLNPEPKEYQLEGTREELARLQLSDTTTFYGIKGIISDFPTEIKAQTAKPERGEKFESGINLIK